MVIGARMKNRSIFRKHFDFLLLDLLCLIVSFVCAFYIRHHNLKLFSFDIYKDAFIAIIVIELLIFFFYDPFKYVVRRGRLKEFKETFKFDIISFLAAVTYLFAFKVAGGFSRLTLAYTYALYFISSYLVRIVWKKHIQDKSYEAITKGGKSLLIVCKEKELDETLNNIYENNYEFYKISGIYVVDKDMDGNEYKGYRIVANTKTILDYVSTNWVDDIFIACNYNEIPKKVIKGFISTGIALHVKLDDIDIFKALLLARRSDWLKE